MSIEGELLERGEAKCELCKAPNNLSVYNVPPRMGASVEECVLVCETCLDQIENPDKIVANHWRCLNEAMWNQEPAVQVVVWRMLNKLRSEGWPQDLLDMLYLEEETSAWAQALEEDVVDDSINHLDSNGSVLNSGDTVVLIKDLNVKGAGFTAKRGTAVRGISLVADNPDHIEGRVSGQQIVILTKFVKKSA